MSRDENFTDTSNSKGKEPLKKKTEVIYIQDDDQIRDTIDLQDSRIQNQTVIVDGETVGLFPNSPYSTIMTMRLSIIKWQETPGTALVWVAREYPELTDCDCIELAEALQCLNPNDDNLIKVIELLQALTPQHIRLVVGYIQTMINNGNNRHTNRQQYHLRKRKSSHEITSNRHGRRNADFKRYPKDQEHHHNHSRTSSQQHVQNQGSVIARASIRRSVTPHGTRPDDYRKIKSVTTTTTNSTSPPIINLTRPSLENESLFNSRFIYRQ